jgi:NAD-specific glutamate dehydrogenase
MSQNSIELTSSLDPGITIRRSDDFVRKCLEILLSSGVIKSTTDETLGGEDCVFRVSDCLYI